MGRLVANKGNGDCLSMAAPMTGAAMPLDVVLVPSGPALVPTPCVNTAKLSDAVQTIDEVKVNGKPVVVRRSNIPRSSGAPNNAVKGIISPPPANNRCNFLSSSATVFAGGYPLVRHRDTTLQNAGNCPGGVKLSEAFTLDGSGLSLDPNDPQAEAVLAALEDLHERPRGRELLDSIQTNYQSTGNTIGIESTNGGNSVDNSFNWTDAGTPGVGASSTVRFNPTRVTASNPRPPAIGLGHELIHSYHIARGTFAPATNAIRANGTMSTTPVFEQQAIGVGPYSSERLTDNHLREERGLPLRHSHIVPDRPDFAYTPSPASIAAQEFSTGAGGEHFVYAG